MYVDMNCQQICKSSRKKLNQSENIPKSFRGGYFFKHPVEYYVTLHLRARCCNDG